MKHVWCVGFSGVEKVAPFVGAWIETLWAKWRVVEISVAPFVGAWIETLTCGLSCWRMSVAPFVGAWIETGMLMDVRPELLSRTLRGCVD